MRKIAARPNNRGSLLLISIVALFIVSALTVLVLGTTSSAVYSNNKQQAKITAFNVAESGAEVAAQWLKNQPYAPPQTTPIYPFSAQTISDGIYNGTYTVVIYPAASNQTSFLKSYRIVSTGQANGISRSVEIYLKQATFGKYAYFTDAEKSSVSGSVIWWMSRDRIDGPVHSNNTGGTNFNIDYTGSTGPIFLDQVTGAGSTINYQPSRPRNETDFKKVFANGSKGYKLGMPRIELPSSTEAQRQAAWGGTSGYPAANGVYLKASANGGIYIVGDSQMTLSLDASGNQKITIVQGSNTTVLTMNKSTGQTTVTGPVGAGSDTSATSLTNGVIYSTGSITSLSGTVADNKVVDGEIAVRSGYTIATDVAAGKDITITGDLVYHTKPDKTQPADDPDNLAAGTLGLVAQEVKIASNGSYPEHPNREVDAVCLAGSQNVAGSFSVNNYSSGCTGTLTVLGGIIQSNRGPVGTISSGALTHGYAKDYRYDPRLATDPPPYFPTTGQYDRLSWRMLPN